MILDLSLGRIRQISAAISQRLSTEQFRQRRLLNWQTKTIATYVAGAAMTDGKGNPLLDEALKLDIDGLDLSELEVAKPIENKPGSYEKLLGMGGGRR